MTILALEFSSTQRSVAVLPGSAASISGPARSEVIETGAVSTRAFEMIDSALHEAGMEREQVECVAVGLGPGSYTGVRAAIAIAQGWQLARGVRLLGVNTAAAIAAQAQFDGMRGQVGVVIDAQRNEFYLAQYELQPQAWHAVEELRLVSKTDVEKTSALLIGPEVTRWFPSGRAVFPRAAMVARLASGRTDFVAGELLEPIYLRETKFVKAPPPRMIP